MHSPRLMAAAGAAAVTLVLGGCSDGEPRPKFAPSDSSSAAGSPAASSTRPVEPTLPPEAREPTKAGAEAFAVYYWRMTDYAQQTGDVATLRSLGDCPACRSGIQSIREIYGAGGRVEGGGGPAKALRSVSIGDDPRLPSFGVIVLVRNSDQVVDLPGKTNDQRLGGGVVKIQMVVSWTSQEWTIARWGRA